MRHLLTNIKKTLSNEQFILHFCNISTYSLAILPLPLPSPLSSFTERCQIGKDCTTFGNYERKIADISDFLLYLRANTNENL